MLKTTSFGLLHTSNYYVKRSGPSIKVSPLQLYGPNIDENDKKTPLQLTARDGEFGCGYVKVSEPHTG